MSDTQSGAAVESIAARLTAWAAVHRSLPPTTFFALYFPALKNEGLAIMTSRDFLSLAEAMHSLLSRAGVQGLAALAQQQQDGVVGQLASAALRSQRLSYAEGFVVPVCCTCGQAPSGHLLRCAKCRVAGYCSKDCQRRQWGLHKKVCPLMAAEMDGVSRTAERAHQAGTPQPPEAPAAGAPAGPTGVAPAAAAEEQPQAAAAAAPEEQPEVAAAAAAEPGAEGAAARALALDPATRRLLLGGSAVLVAAAAATLAVGWWRRH